MLICRFCNILTPSDEHRYDNHKNNITMTESVDGKLIQFNFIGFDVLEANNWYNASLSFTQDSEGKPIKTKSKSVIKQRETSDMVYHILFHI